MTSKSAVVAIAILKIVTSLLFLSGSIALIVLYAWPVQNGGEPPLDKHRQNRVIEFEKDVRDHLPLGSSREAVVDYLDARKIRHSYFEERNDRPQDYRSEMGSIDFRGVGQQSAIYILVVIFKFDNKDRLVRYSVRQGPDFKDSIS